MKFYSSGKILLTGEYVVLQGAKALSLPTIFGQSLEVLKIKNEYHKWISLDKNGNKWFLAEFSSDLSEIIYTTDTERALFLKEILLSIKKVNINIFNSALLFISQLEFDKDWGLGSSSTLINNLSEWAQVNPFKLLENTLGGSGYDIAVAKEKKTIVYRLIENKPKWNTITFNKDFFNKLYFVYLNKKQSSAKEIINFKSILKNAKVIGEISDITEQLIREKELQNFNILLEKHEEIISKLLKRRTVKETLFPDFNGTIKSLGAWGGDFVLANGENLHEYFSSKGYKTIISYGKLIRKK